MQAKLYLQNFFKLKSKTGRFYIIENDRFNIGICQIWACVHFL